VRAPKPYLRQRVVREKNGMWTASRYVYIASTGNRTKRGALARLRECVGLVLR